MKEAERRKSIEMAKACEREIEEKIGATEYGSLEYWKLLARLDSVRTNLLRYEGTTARPVKLEELLRVVVVCPIHSKPGTPTFAVWTDNSRAIVGCPDCVESTGRAILRERDRKKEIIVACGFHRELFVATRRTRDRIFFALCPACLENGRLLKEKTKLALEEKDVEIKSALDTPPPPP